MVEEMNIDDLINAFPWVVFLQRMRPDGIALLSECAGVSEEFAVSFAQASAYESKMPTIIYVVGPSGDFKILWTWDGQEETYDGKKFEKPPMLVEPENVAALCDKCGETFITANPPTHTLCALCC